MKDKISKFINVLKRDGIFGAVKKAWTYILANYINALNFRKRIKFATHKDAISAQLDEILAGSDYDRLIVWRSSFGWNVSLFQRPQQIARCLADKRCLVLYEVTRMTDKVDFFGKNTENLYLIDYEIAKFEALLFEKLKQVDKPKYVQLYSTCWNIKKETIDLYVDNGFKLFYEYIDDLNPVLAGTEALPQNVRDIHNYVITHSEVFVVTSADELFRDMVAKRGGDKNIILSSNGVDYDHFAKVGSQSVPEMEELKKNYKTIVGYYGALASWFDYDLVKKLAARYPDIAFVLIGIAYDTSFASARLEREENIKYLGSKDYKILPDYAKYFDIAWIPFVINEITLATNPIKVFEYMALGKFIITSDMPECRKYKSVNIAETFEDYCRLIENCRELKTEVYDKLLKEEALNNTWDKKADEIITLLETGEHGTEQI